MTTTMAPAPATSLVPTLARREIRRYLQHPGFWIGAALTALSCAGRDARTSSLMSVLAPAVGLGLFGLFVMASLARSSDRAAATGTVSTSERQRTTALAAATVVPFTAALVWFGWAVWAYRHWPPAVGAAPFGGIDDVWVYAMMFDLGVIAAIGGPVIGLVVARWLPFRGAAPVTAVVLVLATIVMQGVFAPLRTVRLVMPWTYFTGPIGIEGDPDRVLILTGSPLWYGGYLLALCALGVLVAAWHDTESRGRGLRRSIVATAVVAVVLCVLAITGGVQATMISPVPSTL